MDVGTDSQRATDWPPKADEASTARRRRRARENTTTHLLAFIALVLGISVLSLAREILIPFALAVLLSFLLVRPVVKLERWGFKRLPAVSLVTLLAIALLGAMGWLVLLQLSALVEEVPKHSGELERKVVALRERFQASSSNVKKVLDRVVTAIDPDVATDDSLEPAVGGPQVPGVTPGVPVDPPPPLAPRSATDSPILVRVVDSPDDVLKRLSASLGVLTFPLARMGMVTVFTLFLLFQRDDLRNRLLRAFSRGRLQGATRAIGDVTARVSRYLVTQSLINGTYGVAIAGGLYLLGVSSWALWGFLAGAFRFLPYIGPWLGALPPILLLAATTDGWFAPLAAAGMFLVLDLAVYILIEPWLFAVSTGVSPFALLAAAVFWTWLWGPVGLFVATPLTVCLVVAGKHFPQLRQLNVLLGDVDPLTPAEKFYQRLLAEEPLDAAALVSETRGRLGAEAVYDQILLPAVVLADNDAESGHLDEDGYASILDATREICEKHDWTEPAAAGDPTAPVVPEPGANPEVLCLASPSDADGLAAEMLASLLNQRGFGAEAMLGDSLVAEMIDRAATTNAASVCIVALTASSRMHARAMTKRIRLRLPQIYLLVLQTVKDPITRETADRVASTTTELLSSLEAQRVA